MKYHLKKDTTLPEFLKIHYAGASNSTLKNFIRNRQIKVNGIVCESMETRLKSGDELIIDRIGERQKTKLPFNLIYEDEAILIVNKQPGILTSGEGITKRPTLHKLVSVYLEQKSKGKVRAYVVHRLDKEVGGLVMFATSEKIVEHLQTNWKNYTKKYLALTRNTPEKPSGTIDTFLVERNLKMNVQHAASDNAVKAITHYKWLRFEKKNSLIEVTLDTGKKNQIRVHLAHIGCPIIGDVKYGDTTKTQVRLLSYSLEITHPVTGKKMHWKIEPDRGFLVC